MIKIRVTLLAFISLNLIGCATAPAPKKTTGVTFNIPGTYHHVEKGQTLWRISKIYAVDLDELAKINRIQDTTAIEVGQTIFIPNRHTPQSIPIQDTSDDFIWPIKGRVVASFGQTHSNIINKGLDIQPGSHEDVIASRSGKVVFSADRFGSFGKVVIIDHGDGFSTVYARNTQVFVKPGDTVEKGGLIARAGSAGRDKATYLHFEIRKGYIAQNPYLYLP